MRLDPCSHARVLFQSHYSEVKVNHEFPVSDSEVTRKLTFNHACVFAKSRRQMVTVGAPSCEFFALKNAFMALCMLCVFDHVQAEGESTHWEALESFRVNVQAKFDEVLETARATNKTVEELHAIMVQFMRKDKRLRYPGPPTTDMANVIGTTEELTLSDSEHAIPYDLDAAWALGTTKDRGGNDESPTSAAVRPAGEKKKRQVVKVQTPSLHRRDKEKSLMPPLPVCPLQNPQWKMSISLRETVQGLCRTKQTLSKTRPPAMPCSLRPSVWKNPRKQWVGHPLQCRRNPRSR